MHELLNKNEVDGIMDFLQERFGIPKEHFNGFCFLRGAKRIWMLSKAAYQHAQDIENCSKWGIRAFTGRSFPYKPSTPFARHFGHYALKNTFPLNKAQLEKYIQGHALEIKLDTDRGSVLIQYEDTVIGTAFYTGEQIESQFPRVDRGAFLRVL